MNIFFDSSFLISLIVESQFTDAAKKVIQRYIDEDFFTSITVVEECAYVLRRLLREPNREIVLRLRSVMDGLEMSVITELPLDEFFRVYAEYDLLPNDALIAATCRHYGIKKIATFDEDFKRVDFLEVLEP